MESKDDAQSAPKPKGVIRQIASLARCIEKAREAEGGMKADFIALKRLNPNADALTYQEMAALTRAFERSDMPYENFGFLSFKRWGFIAHGIALTGHSELKRKQDDAKGKLGRQLSEAGVSEPRIRRLLNARGPAFFQILSRVLRMMQNKSVAANWTELGVLVLRQGTDDPRRKEREERARIKIVSDFTQAESQKKKS
jgi:CRISPR system Cascade subunit CasB